MAKIKTVFVCSSCGYESAKWLGKCPGCNEWNSFYEEKLDKSSGVNKERKSIIPTNLKDIVGQVASRVNTGFLELDRVLRWWIG